MRQRDTRSRRYFFLGIALSIPLVAAAVLLFNALAAQPQFATTRYNCPSQTGTSQNTSFICQAGMSFSYRRQEIKFSGFTFYPALFYGAQGWHRPDFPQYIDQILALAASAGLNEVRPTDMFDESHADQRWDDTIVWRNIDHLIVAAKKYGMFVVLDLSAIRHLLVSQGRDPFDPDYSAWSQNWKPVLDFVGHRYARESAIAFYSIVGEPAAPKTAAERERLVRFYRQSTDELFQADGGHHLIAAGGFNHMEDAPSLQWWQAIYLLPHNTIASFKTYSEDDITYIPTVTAWARQHNKLLVDEEFGMQQGENGEEKRADFYTRVYSRGLQNGVRNFIFWDLGDQLSPTSYQVSPQTPLVWNVVKSFTKRLLGLRPLSAL